MGHARTLLDMAKEIRPLISVDVTNFTIVLDNVHGVRDIVHGIIFMRIYICIIMGMVYV